MEIVKYKIDCKMKLVDYIKLKYRVDNRKTEKDIFEYYENFNLIGVGEVTLEIKYIPDTETLFMNINMLSEGVTKKKTFMKDDSKDLIRVYDTYIDIGHKRYEFLIRLIPEYTSVIHPNVMEWNKDYFYSIRDTINKFSISDALKTLEFLDVNNDLEMIYAGYITVTLLTLGTNAVNIFYNKLLLSGIDMSEVLTNNPDKTRFNGYVNSILKREVISMEKLSLVLIGYLSIYGAAKKITSSIKMTYPNVSYIGKDNLEYVIERGISDGLYI